jgi:hypothetical protein
MQPCPARRSAGTCLRTTSSRGRSSRCALVDAPPAGPADQVTPVCEIAVWWRCRSACCLVEPADPLWLGDPLVEALGIASFPIMCQRAPSRFPVDRSGPRHDQISIGLSAPTAWFQPTCSFGPEPLMPPWRATRMSPDKHPQLRARQVPSPSKSSSPAQSA